MADTNIDIPPFISKVVTFKDGVSYEILKPLTNYRSCHDGIPFEARMVFVCRPVEQSSSSGAVDELVMKIKVQLPHESKDASQSPHPGPSTTTLAEIEVLERFTEHSNPYTPHLIDWTTSIQGPDDPFPGGYKSFTVMTKLPGENLYDLKYSHLPADTQAEIKNAFLPVLRSIYALEIEPMDCALRNILWESNTKKCYIVDFELWRKPAAPITDEKRELQRWALVSRPPAMSWWAEWQSQGW